MRILDALRRGIDHYPGGRPSLSTRLVKNDEVFRKELSGHPSHKLGAMDAVTVAAMLVETGQSNCFDYAAAVAAECGGRFEPCAEMAEPPRSPVQRVSSLMRKTSDVATTVIEAMSDNIISDNELAVIERETAEAESVLQRLRAEARRVNMQGKPAHLAY